MTDMYRDGIINVDALRLVHVRRDFESVVLDKDGNAVIRANAFDKKKPFDNTVHFTLNAVVRPHTYGTHFDKCHCVMISPLRETVEMGNQPNGLLAADTFFHRDAHQNLTISKPIFLAPQGMQVPQELEGKVRRYPRGLTDQETELFKIKAVEEVFTEMKLPFYEVGYDDWSGHHDFKRGSQLKTAFGLGEDVFVGRHANSPAEDFSRMMKHLQDNIDKMRQGVRYITDRYGVDVDIGEKLHNDSAYMEDFLNRAHESGESEYAMVFYRKHADQYGEACKLAAALPPPPAFTPSSIT